MNRDAPLVLGIETSCDETGIGIVRGRELLANVIASSMDEHARYGGVVPEVAARAHLEALRPALTEAVATAGITLDELDAVAVTSGPGLSGALMVGVGAAKALALSLDKPLYAVNHLVGHVGADVLGEEGPLEYPTIALLVSGGHTSLLLVRDLTSDVELLGETIDDAAGEAFDKVARVLGLPYPGGPEIDKSARGGNSAAIRFPRGLTLPKDMAEHRYDFSFSGLKTQILYFIQRNVALNPNFIEENKADICASIQYTIIEILMDKLKLAVKETGIKQIAIGGGVSANSGIRNTLKDTEKKYGWKTFIPKFEYTTDNAAMIGIVGYQKFLSEHFETSSVVSKARIQF